MSAALNVLWSLSQTCLTPYSLRFTLLQVGLMPDISAKTSMGDSSAVDGAPRDAYAGCVPGGYLQDAVPEVRKLRAVL